MMLFTRRRIQRYFYQNDWENAQYLSALNESVIWEYWAIQIYYEPCHGMHKLPLYLVVVHYDFNGMDFWWGDVRYCREEAMKMMRWQGHRPDLIKAPRRVSKAASETYTGPEMPLWGTYACALERRFFCYVRRQIRTLPHYDQKALGSIYTVGREQLCIVLTIQRGTQLLRTSYYKKEANTFALKTYVRFPDGIMCLYERWTTEAREIGRRGGVFDS